MYNNVFNEKITKSRYT